MIWHDMIFGKKEEAIWNPQNDLTVQFIYTHLHSWLHVLVMHNYHNL